MTARVFEAANSESLWLLTRSFEIIIWRPISGSSLEDQTLVTLSLRNRHVSGALLYNVDIYQFLCLDRKPS